MIIFWISTFGNAIKWRSRQVTKRKNTQGWIVWIGEKKEINKWVPGRHDIRSIPLFFVIAQEGLPFRCIEKQLNLSNFEKKKTRAGNRFINIKRGTNHYYGFLWRR